MSTRWGAGRRRGRQRKGGDSPRVTPRSARASASFEAISARTRSCDPCSALFHREKSSPGASPTLVARNWASGPASLTLASSPRLSLSPAPFDSRPIKMLKSFTPRLPLLARVARPTAFRSLSFTATRREDSISSQFQHIQTQPTAGKDGTSAAELARRLSQAVLPKLERPIVKKVLIVGSGGLSIGQAGEFDYSGESSFPPHPAIPAVAHDVIAVIAVSPAWSPAVENNPSNNEN